MDPIVARPSFRHVEPELRLFLGEESLAALAGEMGRQGCRRAVIVCGESVGRSRAMDALRAALGPALVGEVAAARASCPLPAVEAAARALEAAAADAVIAVGGGSAAVTARAASILLAERRPAAELCTRRTPDGRLESPKLTAPKLAQFVVPTTPSTAIVRAGSAVHEPGSGRRLALFDPKTRAKAIFVHPAFLATAPPALVRSASLNTLTAAVEGLESPRCDPIAEASLMHALRLVAENLLAGAAQDAGARERLVLAAVLCGRGTDQTGGGLASGLAHAIGHRAGVANGVVNAVLLPHTMRFNAPATLERATRIVEALRGSSGAARQAVEALEQLLATLGIPRRLREIGVKRAELGPAAEAAMSDWFLREVPRAVSDAATVLSILDAAW